MTTRLTWPAAERPSLWQRICLWLRPESDPALALLLDAWTEDVAADPFDDFITSLPVPVGRVRGIDWKGSAMGRKDPKPMGRIMRAASRAVLGKDMGADGGPSDRELRALIEREARGGSR